MVYLKHQNYKQFTLLGMGNYLFLVFQRYNKMLLQNNNKIKKSVFFDKNTKKIVKN